jgi:hypothetical protein
VEPKCVAVDWRAIIGGALAAAAFVILLAPLGDGFGWSSMSAWRDPEKIQRNVTLIGAIWLILVQWVSSGIGGYMTGRLRTGWADAHAHEVFFRDTAHGFLTWALTTVAVTILLAAGAMHAVNHHNHDQEDYTTGPAVSSSEAYAVNKLFRVDQATGRATEQDSADTITILSEMGDKDMPEADRNYLTQLVHARTGVPILEAQKRVDDTTMQIRASRKAIRKGVTIAEIMMFLSMWIGAFIASTAGALGGQHRDVHYTTGTLFQRS